VLRLQKNLIQAKEEYGKAIELDPDSTGGHLGMGQRYGIRAKATER
jgi:hypothetical protein